MKINELPFPDKVKEIVGQEAKEFNPVQKQALKAGLLDGKNLVIASPTASGKTLIAELAFVKNFLRNGRTVYIVPLKALATEKYHEFKNKYERIGMQIALSIGDLDGSDPWLGNYDLIIVSNEKMDSLLRHDAKWVRHVSLVISDEIHMLNDSSRGPTLEVVLTRLRETTNSQILALSATINNSNEIAEWLDAGLVQSDYRPIKLYRGVSYPDKDDYIVELEKKKKQKFNEDSALFDDTLRKKKQALVFVSTRRSAEAAAEKLNVKAFLTQGERVKLAALSDNVLNALSSPTRQCRRLANVVKSGVAFHHAGLVSKQRKLIEDNFRAGLIKFITATPTLAFGLNLPAWRVIIRDTKRYGGYYGANYIPVMEIHQMMGRAGRPQYDSEGEAIILGKSKNDAEDMKDRYINGEPEPIFSKLSAEPMLRMHTLALIASQSVKSKTQLREFFSKTFFAYQYKDMEEVIGKLEKILEELKDYKFIDFESDEFGSDELSDFTPAFELNKDVKIRATKIGKRVAELYLDPVSAHNIILNFRPMNDIESLLVLNECYEMWPMLRTKKTDDFLETEIIKHGITDIPDMWAYEYDEFMERFKTALMFHDWMSESGEDAILDQYGIAPGELFTKIKNAEWMLYSASELARLLNKNDIGNNYNRLRLRIKHGVKEELLKLIKIRGIGRVRARKLYKQGIKIPTDIKKMPQATLEKIVGPKIAKSILQNINEDLETRMRRVKRRS